MIRSWLTRLVIGCAAMAGHGVHAACAPGDEAPWRSVVDGLWVWDGANTEIDHTNDGHVAPTVALVSGARAWLIDPGPHARHAQRARRSLRCRLGAEVREVINTHAHAENVLGNAAFADDVAAGRVRILATDATRDAMQRRCPACLQSLRQRVGDAAMVGTDIVLPTHSLKAGDVIGDAAVRLQVLRIEQGHTEGDLVLWWPERRVLIAGGLVSVGRVPELAQGSLEAWLAALQRLAALQPAVVIGGSVTDARGLAATQGYLATLRQEVLAAMDAGRLAGERGLVPMLQWRSWAGHAQRQDFNVQRAWRELEPVWMQPPAPPPTQPPLPQQIGR